MEFNSYEYGKEARIEGKLKVRRNLLLLLYVLFTAGAFGAIFASKIYPLGAIVPIFVWMLVFFTWRYVKIDNKYVIESGTLTFTRKYGNTKPKVITEFRIKTAKLIAPLKDNEHKVKDFAPELEYSAVSSALSEDVYVCLYENADGKRCAFYCEVTNAAIKMLRYYNENTVVTKVSA